MINLHLLTKISGYDSNFRKEVLQLIIKQYENVRLEAMKFMEEERWNACQLLFDRYLHDLQPYCQASFLDDLKTLYNTMKTAQDTEIKSLCAKRFLNSLQNGIVEAQAAMMNVETSANPSRSIALDKA